MAKKLKKPWPTKATMTQIYEMKLWGGHAHDFYSGIGSHDPKIVLPFLDTVITFLKSFEIPLTVCDLGCGDFNIGKHLTGHTKNYIAIDIVEALIPRNKTLYQANNLEFHCLDIAKDELPQADCIILRQVLQHLSNIEIQNIIKQIQNYKYLILTEHIPTGNFVPNKDIISGQGIRLKQHSGVNLLAPPFNLKVRNENVLTTHILASKKEHIVTTLYDLF